MHNSFGMIGIPPIEAKRLLQLSIIDFIFSKLASWRDDPNRPSEMQENRLTSQLCDFLTSKAEFFYFKNQEPQKGKSTIDFAAKPMYATASLYQGSIYTPIILFEAKRMPCPDNPHIREKEYVIRTDKPYGGIQRFKNESHGSGHAIASMIGYIQQHDVTYFYNKINEWITELSCTQQDESGLFWSADEQLKEIEITFAHGIARLSSVHSRLTQEPITLHHLWVNMNHQSAGD